MNNFTKIFVFRKPQFDHKTAQVSKTIEEYGGNKNIPVMYTYPNNVEEKILFVSVGGDGTMLGAMRASLNYPNSTVLGLNTGTLGFLTEEVPTNLHQYLDNILLNENVVIDQRMVLNGTATVNGEQKKGSFDAINEFALMGASANTPMVTEIFINDLFVSKQMGSGVLISTSTGSTAMSLSAGGAIVSPATQVMQIVPIMPHDLTSRPIISTGRDTITIRTVTNFRVPKINVNADGQTLLSFKNEQDSVIEFTIKRHDSDIMIWRPKDWNFFNVLAEKMKW